MSTPCAHVGHSGQQPSTNPSGVVADTANAFVRWWTRFWSDFTKLQMVIFWVLLVLAIIALVSGSYYQFDAYWDDKPFVVNIFSSFTAALFGIPLAIILLNKLNLHQGRVMRRRTAREIAEKTLENLKHDMDGLWPGTNAELCDFNTRLLILETTSGTSVPGDHQADEYRSLAEKWNQLSEDNINKLKASARSLYKSVDYFESRVHSDFRELELGWIDSNLDRDNWKFAEDIRPMIQQLPESLDPTSVDLSHGTHQQQFVVLKKYVVMVHEYHGVYDQLNNKIKELLDKKPQSPQNTP